MDELLAGGNTHEAIVRIDGTVRRPTGPWTPGIHALLRHLEACGFDGAPRVRGVDEHGREVLDFIEGEVVHPDHDDLLAPDASLATVAAVIRRLHDAAETFAGSDRYAWSDRGGDPSGPYEIVCHNDLAPWNLISGGDGRWTFIDWDLAAPGRRSWDLAWALLSMVSLMPASGLSVQATATRIACFRDAYGRDAFPENVLAVAVERCRREADLIDQLGAAGEPPYDRLLRDGHSETWHAAEEHIAAQTDEWGSALAYLG